MQGELFNIAGPAVDLSNTTKQQTGWFDHFRVTLRLDHLLIGAILALVLYVLVFSFGVEKGKSYMVAEIRAEKAKQEQMAKELTQLTPSQRVPERSGAASFVAPPTSVTDSLKSHETFPNENSKNPESPINGQYTIQLITFKSRKLAETKVEALKKAGFQGFIIPQGKFFQVCANGFQSVDEARDKLVQLRAQGFAPPDAYIRPLNGIVTL